MICNYYHHSLGKYCLILKLEYYFNITVSLIDNLYLMGQNDACFSLGSIYFRNFAKLLHMQYSKLPRKHARRILCANPNGILLRAAESQMSFFRNLRIRICRCVSSTRGDARTHNVTMQIADGPRQKCLLVRFAVGAAPEAADFNYESSTADRRARAREYFSRPGR